MKYKVKVLEAIRDDLDKLLNSALPYAKKEINESGEFCPYAFALTQENEIECIVADSYRAANINDAQAVLKSLDDGIKRGSLEGRYRAVTLITNHGVVIKGLERTRAMIVQFEHEIGVALEIFYPYDWNGPENPTCTERVIIRNGKNQYFGSLGKRTEQS